MCEVLFKTDCKIFGMKKKWENDRHASLRLVKKYLGESIPLLSANQIFDYVIDELVYLGIKNDHYDAFTFTSLCQYQLRDILLIFGTERVTHLDLARRNDLELFTAVQTFHMIVWSNKLDICP